jgi:hypothetical protein
MALAQQDRTPQVRTERPIAKIKEKNTESPYPLQAPDNLKSVAFIAVEETTTHPGRAFCFGFARSVIL